jgi:hypothetical protein
MRRRKVFIALVLRDVGVVGEVDGASHVGRRRAGGSASTSRSASATWARARVRGLRCNDGRGG